MNRIAPFVLGFALLGCATDPAGPTDSADEASSDELSPDDILVDELDTTFAGTSGGVNLDVRHYYQTTSYWCGPTTAQMVIKYESGKNISQGTIADFIGTKTSGSSEAQVVRGINEWSTPTSYTKLDGFTRNRCVRSIDNRALCPINFKVTFLSYWSSSSFTGGHHSIIKGYTQNGFYIHDTARGPNRYASSAEVYNAVNNWTGDWSVRD